ncbi:MAG: L-glutamate gamma-semialdehyde dehydrogenase [Proteobacteria bacterium]|nr:MAG: L-glutamate gamma-semialdehyde dehydrogenase [Pseudomonadota bacterium]
MTNAISQTPIPKNEPVLGYLPGSPERVALKEELRRQKAEKIQIPLTINGKKEFRKETFSVVIPHNHSHVLADVSQATKEDVNSAVNAALAARKDWSRLPWEARAAVFLKAADLLAGKYRARMNAATMLGQSKSAHQAEIDSACELIDFFRFNAHFAEKIYREQPESLPGMWNRSVARGLEGFVYAITPFNFTSIAVNLPIAPALMGCTVVWKPAHTSMHAAAVGLEILEEAGLPAGVINMVPGDAPTISNILLKHPELSGIHFTGSTATFNHLWKEVANNLDGYKNYPRIVGETGGKDFVFAHPSADAQQLVTGLVRGAFEYQGQKCSAASRAYVPKSLWSEVEPKLVATVKELKVGDVEDFENFMGAVIDKRSFDRIKGYIDEAKSSKDAKILVGGECDDKKGYFVHPTIILAQNPTFRSMTEEIFGPVLTIYVYDDKDIEQAIKLCDESSPYALTGAIYAKDRHAINALSEAFEHTAGNFYINDKPTGAVVGQQPFGGARRSGTNDKAGSVWNLMRWVSNRTIKENFQPYTDYRYPFMKN